MTYTSYKRHCELYTEIHGSIAGNSCQIELAKKDIILPSTIAVIFYKAGSRTGVDDNKYVKFTLSVGTSSIDDFNAKTKVAVLQESQEWEAHQVKDLKLVIPEHYTFMASNTLFIALGILDKYLKKATPNKSTMPPGSYKTSLVHYLPQNHYQYIVNKSTKLKTS